MAPPRRFRVGDVLATTFTVSFRYLVLFALVQLVLNAPVLVISMLTDPVPLFFPPTQELEARNPWPDLVRTCWGYLVGPIAAGFFCYVVIRHLHGSSVSIGDTLRVVGSKFFRLLFTGLLTWLLLVVWLVPAAVFLFLDSPGLLAFAAIVGAPIGLSFYIAASVSTPAVVGEDLGPVAAIRRSFGLTHGYRLPFFGAIAVLWFLTFLIVVVAILIVPLTGLDARVTNVTVSLIALLLAIPWTVVHSVAYTRLRRVKEGATSKQLIEIFE